MPNYYLTSDDRIVVEGDPAAAFLLYGEGSELDDERVNSMKPGLAKELRARIAVDKKGSATTELEAKAEESAPEDKMVEGPAETKAEEGPSRGRGSR